jgi:PAS domain S-box-containing protein
VTEVLNKTDYDFYGKDEADAFTADDKKVLKGQMVEQTEENKGRPVHVLKVPVKDFKDNVAGVLGIFFFDKYKPMFEQAVQGMYVTNPEGRYLDVNKAFADIHGYLSPKDMIERVKDIKEEIYYSPKDRDRFLKTMEQMKRVYDFKYRIKHPKKKEVWVLDNARMVSQSGRIICFEGVVQDITAAITATRKVKRSLLEKRKLLAELQMTLNRLKRVTKVLTVAAISTSIVHDVSDPLTNIRGYCSEMLVRWPELSAAESMRRIRTIHSLCESGLVNIDQVRTFARTGKMEMKPRNLNDLILRCLSKVRNKLEERRIQVCEQMDQIPDILLDDTSMSLVFQNVFGNIVKYVPDGGQLRICTQALSKGRVKVELHDTGDGFPPRFLTAFTSPETAEDVGDGEYGLGLTISQAVVEVHGGKMKLGNSSEDGGAVITIILNVDLQSYGQNQVVSGG